MKSVQSEREAVIQGMAHVYASAYQATIMANTTTAQIGRELATEAALDFLRLLHRVDIDLEEQKSATPCLKAGACP